MSKPREDEYMSQHPLEDFDPDTLDGRAVPTPVPPPAAAAACTAATDGGTYCWPGARGAACAETAALSLSRSLSLSLPPSHYGYDALS